ncbi:hypothetical protein KKH56_06990 [bacterium]|nr:hypothetical protein [bacterium]MBU1487774.1 hypothetical protein [bacterium]
MTDREILANEINVLPDFMVRQLLDIVHYVKLGVENEYISKTDNEFYNSKEFEKIVSESIVEYQSGKTQDMDILER